MGSAREEPVQSRRSIKQRIVLAIFIALLTATYTEKHFVEKRTWPWDFGTYYSAATAIRLGDGHHLLSTEPKYTNRYRADGVGGVPFPYPAATAVLFLPLAYLPVPWAYAAWTTCNLSLLVLSVRILQRHLEIPKDDRPIFAALLFIPVYVCLLHGQVSIVVLFLYAVAFSWFKRGNPFIAGVTLGLGAIKFHLMAGFLAVLLLRRCWKALAGAGVGMSAVGLISALVLGWREALRYPVVLVQLAHVPGFDAVQDNTCLRGLLVTASGQEPPLWLLVAVSALLVVATAILRTDDETAFAAAVAVSVFVAYHAFLQDLTLVLIPAAVIVSRIRKMKTVIWAVSLSLATIAALEYLESVIGGLAHQAVGAATWVIVAFGLWYARRHLPSPAAINPAVAQPISR